MLLLLSYGLLFPANRLCFDGQSIVLSPQTHSQSRNHSYSSGRFAHAWSVLLPVNFLLAFSRTGAIACCGRSAARLARESRGSSSDDLPFGFTHHYTETASAGETLSWTTPVSRTESVSLAHSKHLTTKAKKANHLFISSSFIAAEVFVGPAVRGLRHTLSDHNHYEP
jgi:hypothetical protein